MKLTKMAEIYLFVFCLMFLGGSVSAKGLFNIASTATVTCSSEYNSNYADDNVKDGVIGEWDTGEWASSHGGVGEWVQLSWTQAQRMNEVWVYGRPNQYDRVYDSYLQIDTNNDGTAEYNLHVGMLPGGAAPKIIYLTTAQGATVYAIKFYISAVSSDNLNTGLSEIECYNFGGKQTTGVEKTGQTTSYADYDDGWYEKGNTIIQDNGDGTITDTRTGLMWPKDGTGAGYNNGTVLAWAAAITWAKGLSLAGYTDWRLPNINELKSFQEITWGHYQSQPTGNYWSSTTYAANTDLALIMNFSYGPVSNNAKVNTNYVVAVRGGE